MLLVVVAGCRLPAVGSRSRPSRHGAEGVLLRLQLGTSIDLVNYLLIVRSARKLPRLSTVGILGRCSFDRPLVDLSTKPGGGVAQW